MNTIETLLESMGKSLDEKVFTKELKETLSEKFNQIVEEKSNELAESKFQEKLIELDEKSEEFKNKLQEEYNQKLEFLDEKSVEYSNLMEEKYKERFDALDEKEQEVEEKINKIDEASIEYAKMVDEEVENRLNELNEKAEEYTELFKKDLTEKVSKYLDVVVESFVNDSKKFLDNDLNEAKIEFLEKTYQAMLKTVNIDSSSISDATINELNRLRKDNSQLAEAVADLKNENNKLLKMGIITEMKDGLTLVQQSKFERLAEMIEFEKDKSFIKKLENLKESISDQNDVETKIEKPLNFETKTQKNKLNEGSKEHDQATELLNRFFKTYRS